MKPLLPVLGNLPPRARNRLIDRMRSRRRKRRTVEENLRSKIIEPRFAWLEACDDGMARGVKMRSRVAAGLNYRSTRCGRISRNGVDAATNLRWLDTPSTRFRSALHSYLFHRSYSSSLSFSTPP